MSTKSIRYILIARDSDTGEVLDKTESFLDFPTQQYITSMNLLDRFTGRNCELEISTIELIKFENLKKSKQL